MFIHCLLNVRLELVGDNNKHLSFLAISDVFLFQQRDQILSLLSYLLFVLQIICERLLKLFVPHMLCPTLLEQPVMHRRYTDRYEHVFSFTKIQFSVKRIISKTSKNVDGIESFLMNRIHFLVSVITLHANDKFTNLFTLRVKC